MSISRKWVGNLPNVLSTRGAIANMAAKEWWKTYISPVTARQYRTFCIDAWWNQCEIVLADKGDLISAKNWMIKS